MCRLMVMDAPVRRMLTVLAIFLPIGVVFSIWRGDSFGTTVGYALVGVGVVGALVALHLYVGRRH